MYCLENVPKNITYIKYVTFRYSIPKQQVFARLEKCIIYNCSLNIGESIFLIQGVGSAAKPCLGQQRNYGISHCREGWEEGGEEGD